MNAFLDVVFHGPNLQALNQVSLCLQGITVADLACPDGATLHKTSFLAEACNGFCKHLVWPHLTPLSTQTLSLWQRALSESLLLPGTTSRQLLPCYKVGSWLTSVSSLNGPGALPWLPITFTTKLGQSGLFGLCTMSKPVHYVKTCAQCFQLILSGILNPLT